jgi:hypothetical protein
MSTLSIDQDIFAVLLSSKAVLTLVTTFAVIYLIVCYLF